MERLTKKHYGGNGYYMACSEHCNKECFDCKEIDKIIDRLGTYEDTGLEPQDIISAVDMAKIACALHELNAYKDIGTIDHLRDLLQAEKEGRMVLLPCKVGDTVWVIWGKDVIYYIVDSIHILANNQVQIRAKHHVIDNVYLYPDMFGKTVFLTREEAEAALALKGGEG